jgi:hypothetical protein
LLRKGPETPRSIGRLMPSLALPITIYQLLPFAEI